MKKYLVALSVVLAIAAAAAIYQHTSASRPAGNDAAQPSPSLGQPAGAAGPSQAAAAAASAQNPVNDGYPFQDTSMLKPPAGARVAIFEFEDLECPACAHAFPVVRSAVERYKIPLLRHDYPWFFHAWALDAAVTARYLQDHVSPRLAEEFRGDVFAAQTRIASKDDLAAFTRTWFQSHGQTLPFVLDASGACRNEVESDRALGDRLGVHSTPCIIVVTQTSWIPVADVAQLDHILDQALSQTSASATGPSAGHAFLSEPHAARLRS